MKNFFRENVVLMLGLTLPVLLIAVFFFASILPKILSEPPQYDMLFVVSNYQYSNKADYAVDFSIRHKRVMMKLGKKEEKKYANRKTDTLLVYKGKSQTIREIKVSTNHLPKNVEIPVAEVNSMIVDTSSISPDGYAFDARRYRSRGLIGSLFGGGSRNNHRIVKGNISYKLPINEYGYYYNKATFLGWIVGEKE